ncbi:MAG: N-acetylmuramoyl-L-alanine amidase [Bacteroidales bacterium]|nr:N-acetylmuramoyl-L-alanine amidase [Bacteroidales bacterium]
MRKLLLIAAALLLCLSFQSAAQTIQELFQPAANAVAEYFGDRTQWRDTVRIRHFYIRNSGPAEVHFNRFISEQPLRKKDIDAIYSLVRKNFPAKYKAQASNFAIYSDGNKIEKLYSRAFPETFNAEEMNLGKAPSEDVAKNSQSRSQHPLTKNLSKPGQPSAGLQGRHIAVWQSHGYYYEQSLERWEWQRSRLMTTVEDIYTQSYVLPFLVPMLEKAGATVLLPRERDLQRNMLIVDNNHSGELYVEHNGQHSWRTSESAGYADRAILTHGVNPFKSGSARVVECTSDNTALTTAFWQAKVPHNGEYAVYVSYPAEKNASNSAHYWIRHNGGATQFEVNQQMSPGTWVYLGTFGFSADSTEHGVFLSNFGQAGKVVGADAVRYGAGMGNVARKPADNDEEGKPIKRDHKAEAKTSGLPRYAEGARYYLQFAGMDTLVYSVMNNQDDYRDDYTSRAEWVNAMIGGTSRLPGSTGYNVPLDMAIAIHSDAGLSMTDSIVGTLGIYTETSEGSVKYKYGGNRIIARELVDIVQSQVVRDIRATFEPQWSRREIYSRNYYESRVPEIPTMLLELLSHQNFADMRLGLDPSFRFVASRAIYKGILKYLAYINNEDYVVQPLPVKDFAVTLDGRTAKLEWQPTMDKLEATSDPTGYIVYTRVTDPDAVTYDGSEPGNGISGFDNGVFVANNAYSTRLEPGKIYSFKVTAVNTGGESFESEILSAGINEKNPSSVVLVLNNFTRVAAPASYATADSSRAAFLDGVDAGVAYHREIAYVGPMMETDRSMEWVDDDNPGFGASSYEYEGAIFAGNTFDYPLIHGASIMKAGYSFTSAAASVAERLNLSSYPAVDVICGKQIRTVTGVLHDSSASSLQKNLRYVVFTPSLMNALKKYSAAGGNILISGANIASDSHHFIYDIKVDAEYRRKVLEPEIAFARDVLKYTYMNYDATSSGLVKTVDNSFNIRKDSYYNINVKPAREVYCVEAADGLVPSKNSATIMRYGDSNISAGVAYKGKDYRCVSLGFPIEALTSIRQTDHIMSTMLEFLLKD